MLLPNRKHLCRLSREHVAINGNPEIGKGVGDPLAKEIWFGGQNVAACPRFSASASVDGSPTSTTAPLSAMARWNNPFDSGDVISTLTSSEPADSPKIVTFFGSPPKRAMFSCTHRIAAI